MKKTLTSDKKIQGVILSAGKTHVALQHLFGDQPSGLVPVNGRPCIFYVIDSLLKRSITDIHIAVGYRKEKLIEKVRILYQSKANLHFVEVDENRGPGDSLLSVIDTLSDGGAMIMLGDTILTIDQPLKDEAIVWTSTDFDDPSKWCLVTTQAGIVDSYFDKNAQDRNEKIALVGAYYLPETSKIREGKNRIQGLKRTELSDILKFVQNEPSGQSIRAVAAKDWVDVGHIEKYQAAKKTLLSTRFFNSLSFDPILGTVTKRSSEAAKFRAEAAWYTKLPNHLKILSPRILDMNLEASPPQITMEYYGYPSVAELWLYSEIPVDMFETILKKLLTILKLFQVEKANVGIEDYRLIYIEKTKQRLDILAKDSQWSALLKAPEIRINGRTHPGLSSQLANLASRVEKLYHPEHNCLIHGDFCFSNILYDIHSGTLRLLDPRGIWGSTEAGDIKYDVAKLRHSISGKYDFIVNDFFTIQQNGTDFQLSFPTEKRHEDLKVIFDSLISQTFDLSQIRLIESLLFLSMIPLHSDKPNRQLAMFLNGIMLLDSTS